MHQVKAQALIAILLVSSFLFAMNATFVSAQGPSLPETYTSASGDLTLNYPAGWYERPSAARVGVTLSNVVISDDGVVPTNVAPGQIVINVVRAVELESSQFSFPRSNNPVFIAGYFSGQFMSLLSVFSDGQSLSVGDVVQTEVNGLPAAYADLLGGAGVMRIFVSTVNDELILTNIIARQDEFAQWDPLMFSIVESIEIHEVMVSDTDANSAADNTTTTIACNNVAQSITIYAEDLVVPTGGENFLLDGNPDTGWSSTSTAVTWFFVDLDGLQTVTSIQLNGYASSGIPENSVNVFFVQQLSENEEWETILTSEAPMQPGNQSYTFAPVTTDLLTIFLNSNHGGTNIEITDIMVCAQ